MVHACQCRGKSATRPLALPCPSAKHFRQPFVACGPTGAFARASGSKRDASPAAGASDDGSGRVRSTSNEGEFEAAGTIKRRFLEALTTAKCFKNLEYVRRATKARRNYPRISRTKYTNGKSSEKNRLTAKSPRASSPFSGSREPSPQEDNSGGAEKERPCISQLLEERYTTENEISNRQALLAAAMAGHLAAVCPRRLCTAAKLVCVV